MQEKESEIGAVVQKGKGKRSGQWRRKRRRGGGKKERASINIKDWARVMTKSQKQGRELQIMTGIPRQRSVLGRERYLRMGAEGKWPGREKWKDSERRGNSWASRSSRGHLQEQEHREKKKGGY